MPYHFILSDLRQNSEDQKYDRDNENKCGGDCISENLIDLQLLLIETDLTLTCCYS